MRKTIFILVALLAATTSKAVNDFSSLLPSKIERSPEILYHDTLSVPFKILRHKIDSLNIGAQKPGFNGTVLVGYQGKLIFEKSYGVANRGIGLPNSSEIPTQIASISKTFTGTAILWLQQKGLLDITDKVQQYLWDFPYPNITIENLLNHRSGLPDYMDFSGKYWDKNQTMYNEDVLNLFVQNKYNLKFTPDTKHQYSNSNYALLGLIIERISSMKYADFMNKYVFEPMKMEKTFVYDPEEEYGFSMAKSYKSNFKNWNVNYQDGVYGDKGIFTTAEDLYRWDKVLYTEDFVDDETKQMAFTPSRPLSVKKNYGLGWRIKYYPNGERYVYHTGWWHGYQGIFSRYIKDEFTVIILSNRYIKGITANAELIYKVAQEDLNLTELS